MTSLRGAQRRSKPRASSGDRSADASRRFSRLPSVHETSAGGVVVRRIRGSWHVALLKTRHTRGEVWVLPKGHVEHHRGETKDVAAVREVQEELGIEKVRVLRKLGTVRWQFMGERERQTGPVLRPGPSGKPVRRGAPVRVVKTVHHYLMEGLSPTLRPQRSEGFLAARWVPLTHALKLLAYPTDQEIVAKVFAKDRRPTVAKQGGLPSKSHEFHPRTPP